MIIKDLVEGDWIKKFPSIVWALSRQLSEAAMQIWIEVKYDREIDPIFALIQAR